MAIEPLLCLGTVCWIRIGGLRLSLNGRQPPFSPGSVGSPSVVWLMACSMALPPAAGWSRLLRPSVTASRFANPSSQPWSHCSASALLALWGLSVRGALSLPLS